MFEAILCFIIGSLATAICLWLGMKITNVKGSFLSLIVIGAVHRLAGIIIVAMSEGLQSSSVLIAGWILSTILLFVLICKLTDAKIIPDAFLMILVASMIHWLI